MKDCFVISRSMVMTEKTNSGKIKCPICRKETTWENNIFKPFCSERCKLEDLGKWASEEYRVAGEKKNLPDADRDEEKEDRN